jgi:hypothetical protein
MLLSMSRHARWGNGANKTRRVFKANIGRKILLALDCALALADAENNDVVI